MTGRRSSSCPWSGRRSCRRPYTIAWFCAEHHPPAGLSADSAADFPNASSTEHSGQGGSFHGPWARLSTLYRPKRNQPTPGSLGHGGCACVEPIATGGKIDPRPHSRKFFRSIGPAAAAFGTRTSPPDIGGASCRAGTARSLRQPRTPGSPGSHPDHARSIWQRNYRHLIRHGRDPPQCPDFQTCLGILGCAPKRNECNCREPVTSAREERPVTPGAGRRNPQDRPLRRAKSTAATGGLAVWFASHADHRPPSDLASRRLPPQSRLGRQPGRINESRSVPARKSTGSPTAA